MAVMALLSSSPPTADAANETCPGGSHSGEGSSSGRTCPSLHNANLLPERPFPRDLYRGDSRAPSEIFDRGFTARGVNYDLPAHVQGDRAGNSGYVSTTGTRSVAEQFARSQGQLNLSTVAARQDCRSGRYQLWISVPTIGRYLVNNCEHDTVTAESYVYTIDPVWASNALYVPDQIRGNTNLYNHYRSQDEWAYVHQVPNYAITGVRMYRMTATQKRGLIDQRTITFRFDRWVPNPNHLKRRMYDPASDPGAHFNFETDLHVPSPQANRDTRGCSKSDRCRGGK